MTTKTKIIILSTLAAISYAGFFIYQRRNRKIADQSVVSIDEALLILNKNK
jgi:ribosome-associated protein YbcJ (S4-like RNA binding protein)